MKGWGLEEKELLLLHTFKNKETNKNPEKWYRERNITKAHWLVLPLKRELFCVWALTVIGVLLKLTGPNAHISNTRNSSVDYYGYFILTRMLENKIWFAAFIIDEMKFPFCTHDCWPLRHRLPHELHGVHAEWGLPSWAAAQGILNSVLTFILDHASLISVQLGINSHVTAWTGSLAILVAVVSPERNHLCILL